MKKEKTNPSLEMQIIIENIFFNIGLKQHGLTYLLHLNNPVQVLLKSFKTYT